MGISNLTNDISVHYTNNHSVFRCVVLIFILDYQSFPSIVVSFALSPSFEFHLVSLEVGLVLDNFNKPHPAEQNPDSAACHRAAEPERLRGGKIRRSVLNVVDLLVRDTQIASDRNKYQNNLCKEGEEGINTGDSESRAALGIQAQNPECDAFCLDNLVSTFF